METNRVAPLFIGIGGHVVAIDPRDGSEIWRTKLASLSPYVTIYRTGSQLYAATGGELWRIDPASGEILWENKLKGLGVGMICFPGSDIDAAAQAEQAAGAVVIG
jgi:outer membrane protein assembly factor BamB